jgi:hypothetical protein
MDGLTTVTLNDCMDKTQMEIIKNGKFPLKSLYEILTVVGLDRIKIEIWLWLIWHNAIATILDPHVSLSISSGFRKSSL